MFFDLHTHLTLKPFLSHLKPDKKISCWEPIKVCLFFDEFSITGDRLDSQSCLTQMFDGKVTLTVVALHALEREMSETIFIKILSLLSMKLSNRLLSYIRKCRPGYGYIDLIRGEFIFIDFFFFKRKNNNFSKRMF